MKSIVGRVRWIMLGAATLLLLWLMYFGGPKAHAATSALTGTITDSQGNPVYGTLTMQLPVAAQDTATNTAIAPIVQRYQVVNGVIQSGPPLFDVAGLQPKNLFYIAKVYDQSGNLILNGNYVVTGATFNLGAATPTTVTTSNISYVTPVVLSNANTFTQAQAAPEFASISSPLALSGFIRMANTDAICWRNAAGSADACIGSPTNPIGAGFAYAATGTISGTNFGSNVPLNVIGNVGPVSGAIFVQVSAIQSVVGVGCSAAGNNVTPTVSYTSPHGVAQTFILGTTTITGNGVLDSGVSSFQSLPAQANTAVNVSTTSVLNSSGCSTVPQYTLYTKVIQ